MYDRRSRNTPLILGESSRLVNNLAVPWDNMLIVECLNMKKSVEERLFKNSRKKHNRNL